MEQYQSNSHKSKEKAKNDKKLNKVVTGSPKLQKKSDAKKFADSVVSETVPNAVSYVLMDVLLPSIKQLLYNVINDGTHMLLFGDKAVPDKRTPGARINYTRFSEPTDARLSSYRARSGFDYDDIIFDTIGEAELVRKSMNSVIDTYSIVSVADMYDLAGVSNDNFQNNKYGWTNIDRATVVRLREGGYILKMPKAMPID